MFKKGDVLVCVDATGFANSTLTEGMKYVVYEDQSSSTNVCVKIGHGKTQSYLPERFKLAEEPVEEVTEPAKRLFTIEYEGITLTFDANNLKSRKLVEGVLDVIYKGEF